MKSPDIEPLLDRLTAALAAAGLDVTREAEALHVNHRGVPTVVSLVPSEDNDSPIGPVKCVVQIRTELPGDLRQFVLDRPETVGLMNRMASLGALTYDQDHLFVGSRLTIFQSEDALKIQGPMILRAIQMAMDSMIIGTGKALSGEATQVESSAWTEQDFDLVESAFEDRCVCSRGHLSFVAEFALRSGEVTAVAGDPATALWSMSADEPHPALGGGLLCMLQLPHSFPEKSRLPAVLREFNRLEMQPYALPPHFGAWCVGKTDGTAAYISFLPNELHNEAPGIAVNMTVWASARAQWAGATLAAMGISLAK